MASAVKESGGVPPLENPSLLDNCTWDDCKKISAFVLYLIALIVTITLLAKASPQSLSTTGKILIGFSIALAPFLIAGIYKCSTRQSN